jgi:DNA-directed RNA polymerase specialized sigma24 family protein
MDPDDSSITLWLAQLQAGNPAAAQPLWERYFRRLVGLARAKLQGVPRRAADEEDVALSAFDSFCRRAADNRFPRLNDRDDLWRLLVTLTERRAIRLARHESRQKRGGGGSPARCPATPDGSASDSGLGQLAGREPTPEFAAQVAEECRRLLEQLGDAELRSIAVWKMEGDTNEEIAGRIGSAPRTVERTLRLIRALWEEGAPE